MDGVVGSISTSHNGGPGSIPSHHSHGIYYIFAIGI